MAWLIEPPDNFDLPVSKGGDLQAVFIYKPIVVDENGLPVLLNGKPQYQVTDFPPGATVTLVVESTPPISGEAVIIGPKATVSIDKAEADTIKSYQLWRLVMTVGTLDEVLVNGQIVRSDGRPIE